MASTANNSNKLVGVDIVDTQNISDNIIQIGEFRYHFNLFLFNDQKQFLPLNRAAIKQLTITDNIFNPFHSATLIINSDQQIFERTDFNYTFLGNGRDIIYVELMQALSENNDDFTNERNRKLFALNFAFVVVECNDMNIDNFTYTELHMTQYERYILNEATVQISSKTNRNANNQDRSENTGELIKKILVNVFGETYQNKQTPLIDENNFDKGKNQIMFTPQGNYSSMNAIRSILYQHQGEKNFDWCVLDCERYTKTFSLQSLADIFSKHNELVIETINLKQLVENEKEINGGVIIGSFEWYPNSFSFNDLSDIINHYTDHANAKDIYNLQSNVITTSDIKPDKAFTINIKQGYSQDVLTEFGKLYIEPFKPLFQNKKLIPIIKLNNLQLNGKAAVYKPSDEPADISNNTTSIQKYNAMLFMDRVNIFHLKGLTSRKSGHFIDVTTETNELKTMWDFRNVGRHFITSVQHIFTQDTYTNKIETIKPYTVDYTPANK